MNKKLIKKLKSVGFEQKSTWLSIILNSNEVCYFYLLGGELDIGGTSFSKKGLTFKQILAAIKEHTGVDLQPKKTKTQRIEALEELVKLQNEAINKLEERTKENAKAVKGVKGNVNLATVDKILESLKELHSLAITLNTQKANSSNFEDGGLMSDAKVHTGESVLSAFVEERNNKIKEAIEKITTPTQDKMHAEMNEPKFKVGDEVVLTLRSPYKDHDSVVKAAEAKTICKVVECKKYGYKVDINPNGEVSCCWMFNKKELQHAPKKLKLGGWAEVVGNTSRHGFKTGQKVLVGALCSDDDYCCSTIDDWNYLRKEDLKPL